MLFFAVLFCNNIFATDFHWKVDGTDGNWSTYTNWEYKDIFGVWHDPDGDPPNDDDNVYFRTGTYIITLDSDIEIDNLYFGSEGETNITINTNGYNLLITGELDLQKKDDTASHSVTMNITGGGSITTANLDLPEDLNGYDFKINIDDNTVLNVTNYFYGDSENGNIQVEGSGTILVANEGDDSNISYGPSLEVYKNNSTDGTETYTVSTSPALEPGVTSTVTIKSFSTDSTYTGFSKIYFDITLTNNDTTLTENYNINGIDYSTSSTNIETNFAEAKNQNFDIILPSASDMDNGDGFTITIKESTNTNVIGTITYTAHTVSTYASGEWDYTPAAASTKNLVFNDNFNLSSSFIAGLTNLNSIKINTGKTVSLDDDITSTIPIINNGTIDAGNNNLSVTDYSGSGTIALNGGTFTNNNTSDITIETLTLSSSESTISGTTGGIIVSNNITSGNLKTDGEISLKGTLTQLNVNSGTTTLSGALSLQDVTITAAGNLSANGKNISVTGDWTNNRGIDGFTAGGNTVTFSGSGKTVSGSQTFDAVIISDSTEFTATNTFASLTCTTGGVTITFPAGTTTTSALNITGASGSLVTLASSGAWTLDAPTTSTLSYLTVSNCTATNELTANNSTDGGNNTNWNFSGQTYTWNGANGAFWSTASNWSPASVPGKGSTVEIRTADAGPALGTEIDLGTGTILVDTGAILDLNGNNLTCGTFTLNGKLRQAAEETIAAAKVFGTDYTLEYYGTAESKLYPANFSATIPNVIIKDKQLRIMGNVTIENLTNNKNLELQSNTLTVTTTYSSSADSIVSTNGGTFTNSTGSSLTIPKLSLGTNESTLSGNFSVTTITTSNGKLKTAGNTSLQGTLDSLKIDSGTLTLTENLTVTTLTNKGEIINSGKDITVNTTYSGTSDTLTLSGGTLTYNGTDSATFGTITQSGDVVFAHPNAETTINSLTISTANEFKNTNNALTIGTLIPGTAGTKLNGDAAITVTNDISDSTSVLNTDGTVSLKGTLAQLNVTSGTTTLSGTSTVTTLNTTGETILAGALTVQNLTIAAITGKLTANSNNITVTGDWTNNHGADGFDAGGNTVTFTPVTNDADQTSTLTGSTTFNYAVFNGKTQLDGTNSFTTLLFETNAEGTISTVQNVTGTTYIQNNTDKSLTFTEDNIFEGGVQICATGMHPSYAGTITLQGKTSTGAMRIVNCSNATQLTFNSPVILTCNATTTGTQTYNGAITLGQNITLTGTDITLANTVDSDETERELQIIGNVDFQNTIGATKQLSTLKVMTTTTSDETKISTTSIKTSGAQIYNGAVIINEDTNLSASNITFENTVDDDTDSTHVLTLTGNSTFNKSVGATAKLKELISDSTTASVTINTTEITTSDLQNYAGPVIITQNEKLTADIITFVGTVTATGYSLELDNTTTNIGANITASTITDNGNVNFTAADINLTATTVEFSGTSKTVGGNSYTVTGDFVNSGSLTYNVAQTVTGNLSNTGTFIANSGGNINLAGNFTDSGTWTPAAGTKITLDGTSTDGRIFIPGTSTYADIILSNTNDENLNVTTNPLTAANFTITKGKEVTFSNDVTVNGTLTITHADKVQFDDTTTIGTFTDTTDSKQLVINASTTINSDATINTSDIQAKTNLTTNGNLTINGETTLTGDFEYKTLGTGNSVFFTAPLTGSHNLTITSAKDITLTNAPANTTTLLFDAQGIITLQDSNIDVSTLSFLGNTVDPSASSTATIKLNNSNIVTDTTITIPFSTTLSGTAQNLSITAPNIVFPHFGTTIRTLSLGNNSLKLNGYTMFNGTLTGTGTFTVNGDLIINNAQTNTTTLNAPVIVDGTPGSGGNLVVYNGTLSVGANITITNDLLFFGSAYDTKDAESGNDNIYYYHYATASDKGINPMHGRFNIGTPDPDGSGHKGLLPDGTQAPISTTGTKASDVSAKLSTTAAVTIQAGQSFYANGLTATSSANWNLKLKSNKLTSENFAQAFNCNFSSSSCNVSNIDTGSAPDALQIAAENCSIKTGYTSGWDNTDFKITSVRTVHDNIIEVTLNRAISNADNILNTESTSGIYNPTRLKNKEGTYTHIYKTVDFNTITPKALPAEEEFTKTEIAPTDDNVTVIYIKTSLEKTWNTDARGTSEGDTNSTDTHGRHKTNIPYLDIQRNTTGTNAYNYYITDLYGKRLKQYSDTTKWTTVTDNCSPVIVSVKTGQERHTVYDTTKTEGGQPSCDSHNFIEFRYSEPVDFYNSATATTPFIPADITAGTPNNTDNILVTTDFGEITNNTTGFTVKGLGTLENGKIVTGSNGTQTSLVNTLYKNNHDTDNLYDGDRHSIRLSIAGYTNGTAIDRDGNIYKKWVGYIDEAQTPYGAYTLYNPDPVSGLNKYIRDLVGNAEKVPSVPVNVNSKEDSTEPTPQNLYSAWDTSSPVFTPARLKILDNWETTQFSEAVGASNGSTLDRIEFHFFDNSEDTNTAVWFTQKGWCDPATTTTNNQPTLYDSTYTYCADIIGGARPYQNRTGENNGVSATTQTTGGIRFSTKENINSYFKYAKGNGTPSTAFGTDLYPKVTSSIFTGPSLPRRSNDDPDGLYLGLSITESSLPVETTFTVKYDETGYLTDLAGNRLRTATISTIDRTPPSIDMCLSPINQDELFLIVVKELTVQSNLLAYKDDTTGNDINITQTYEQLLPYCFELMSLDSAGTKAPSTLSINRTVPAKIETFQAPQEEGSTTQKSSFTYIRLKLNRNITLEDVENLYIRLIAPTALGYPETSKDPITNITGSRVTLIQDSFGNYMQMFTAHAISDFLIGGVNPLYAYDTDMTYGEQTIMNGLYEDGSWAVHDWNAEQQNFGTLPANHPIALTASLDDGTERKQNIPEKVRLYFTNLPDADSVSKQYNYDFNRQLRIWLPDISNGLFPGLSHNNNKNYLTLDSQFLGEKASDGLIWNIDKETTSTWTSQDQISFLFGILKDDGTPVRIYNAPYFNATNAANNNYDLSRSTAVPLYSLRLLDPADILSLDLWSFRVRSITEQRGGVTVLNNVINSTTGEKTVLKVNMPADGKLNVIVMTLDGNVVQYLTHGQTTAGEHYYSWNGKNQKGTPVARGMYFVRVVGNGIDETRKVMVVK